MIKGWPAMALTVVAAIAIGAGLALTGGPGQARKERRDQQRADDLSTLAGLVECLAGTNRGQLPDRLAVTLEEHQAAALWQGEDRRSDRLVNTHGEVFEANVGDVEDDALPTLAGPEARSSRRRPASRQGRRRRATRRRGRRRAMPGGSRGRRPAWTRPHQRRRRPP